MEKKVSKEEQELADKILPLLKEVKELGFRGAGGVTLEKSQYIQERTANLNEEIGELKRKSNSEQNSVCDHDNVVVETAADFYCPKCQRMVSWLEYNKEQNDDKQIKK